MGKLLMLLLGFSLTLTSCKKEVIEPINKSLNIVDSLSIVGYVSKDSLVHKFNVQYLANITIDTLVLEDEMGNSTMLSKITPTTFSSSDFLGVEGRLYRLKLFYYGNVYEDFGTMPYADSLTNFSVNVNLKINF
jgi:hypothetical protein